MKLEQLKKMIREIAKKEMLKEEEINWNAVENAIINFLKTNTKILDKKVQSKDTEGVKNGLKSILSGLTNAQRSLKLESASRTAMEIGGLTGLNKDVVQKFVDTHKLDIEKVFQFVKKGNPADRMDFVAAVSSPILFIRKKIIKKLQESVNEDFKSVVGKTVFSDGKGKLHFGYYKEDDSAYFVDYKTWAKLGMKDVSKGDTNKDKVINSILRNQKQFNKKVDYNMWAKKTNPSFEEKMDWFIKNGWISNITKAGIKEEVESVNEAKKYDIGSGYLGNGLTIWNRAEKTEDDDYETIAHIGKDGKLTIYDKEIPADIKKMFGIWATSMKKGNRPGSY